jgi:hypothetical protein
VVGMSGSMGGKGGGMMKLRSCCSGLPKPV